MAYETVTSRRITRMGRMTCVKMRVTTSGVDNDIATGLKRVDFASMQGIDTADNDVQIMKNTITGADNTYDVMGTIHFVAAANGAIYQVVAMGTA